MDKRRQLTALRKELKSANKERSKQIQALIAEIESAPCDTAVKVQVEPQIQDQQAEEQQRRAERDRLKKKEREVKEAAERERLVEEAKRRIQEGPQLDVVEGKQFEELLREHRVSIHMINPDGNCLFEAVSHQLSLFGIALDQLRLREICAKYILQNEDNYSPFIDLQEHSCSTVQDYSVLVCKSGWWGGDVELDSLAHAIPAHIKVYKSDGIVAFNTAHEMTLQISYHRHQYTLGAHYNSLVPSISIE